MTINRLVVAGVDTHSKTHHVAVLDAATGQPLGDHQFPATSAGYRAILTFVNALGQVLRFGIEGTNSYGAGLTRYLVGQGVKVSEVIRPNRAERRLRGKSDPLDALNAAEVALRRTDLPIPKSSDGDVESIRVLSVVRKSAVKARANVLRQVKTILVSAPALVREKLAQLDDKTLLASVRRTRPGSPIDGVDQATQTALRLLARRYQYLTEEIDENTGLLQALTQKANPALLATHGVGVVTAAQLLVTAGDNPERITSKGAFAALTGTSPIPASSGKTTRHRLNRGGDRHANNAIHTIAITRMGTDPRTRAFIEKKMAEGKTKLEATRCLKRHIANEIYRILTNPPGMPEVSDLRETRRELKISLQVIASNLNTWPGRISEIERGTRHDDDLTARYRELLSTL